MPNLIPREATLHTTATAVANGALVNVDGMGAVGLQVANTGGTFTITCEVNIDVNGTWETVPVLTKTNNTVTAGGTITAAGLYLVDVSGAHQFRARINAASGCSVTVKCVVYEGTVGYVDIDSTLDDLEAHAGTIDTNVASALTSLQTLDNIVSGSKALVTEDSAAGILTALTTPTGINGGPVTVGATAVEMTFTGTTKVVSLMSDHTNTGKIWWGPSSVTSAGLNAYGRLAPGQAVEIEVNDASAAIYTVSDTAAQTVYKAAIT